MKHVTESWPVSRKVDAFRAVEGRIQSGIHASALQPYRTLNFITALMYASMTVGFALLGRMLYPRRPIDALSIELGERYANIPEMALHKKIELDRYLACGLKGLGIDFGAGNGVVGGLLLRHVPGIELHGVDSLSQREFALDNGYADYTEADITAIPLPSESFEFAVSICVLEHVPDLDAALSEGYRLVRPGGAMVFTTPSPGFRKYSPIANLLRFLGCARLADRFLSYRDAHAQHYTYLDAETWKGKLEKLGFSSVRVEPIFSIGAFFIYESLNVFVHMPRFFPCSHLARMMKSSDLLRRLMIWATTTIAATHGAGRAAGGRETHYFIEAIKVDSSQK